MKYCHNTLSLNWLILATYKQQSVTPVKNSKLIFFANLGPIFEHNSESGYSQDSNLRLNIASAKFVETIITDSWGAGFKNYDNVKPGHRNIYINGGENHPHCQPKTILGPQARK